MSAPASQPAWAPVIPDFDASRIDTFPRVFISREELDRARRRVRDDAWAKDIFFAIRKEADEGLTLTLEPVDENWWNVTKTQPWDQTYPAIFENTHRKTMRYARPASQCALAWAITGETRYADRACDLLMLLAPYQFVAEHYDVGMNYTAWGTEMLVAYDLVGARLGPAERRELDACMTRLARAVLRNDIYWIENNIGGGLNNHLAWHKMMFGFLGAFYGRRELVDFAMTGPRGLVPLLGDCVMDHGLWCESSLNYHFAGIAPHVRVADVQHRMGLRPTLYEVEAANGRGLKQTLDAMLDMLFPDMTIPPVGDAYAIRARLADNPLYEYGWAGYRDPRYAWLLRQAKRRYWMGLFVPDLPQQNPPPRAVSMLLPEHGYVLLRDGGTESPNAGYWNSGARCVFLTYDRNGVHSNADKLSWMFFGSGQLLLADREARATVPHAFSSQVQRQLNRGTICHNTIMLDETDHRGTDRVLRLLEYHVTPAEQRTTVADLEGLTYEGVRLMRTLILAPQYVLDVFQVDAGARERQIDWIVHPFDGEGTFPPELNAWSRGGSPLPVKPTLPWNWLRDLRSVPAPGTLKAEWRRGDVGLRLFLPTPPASSCILGGFPMTDEPNSKVAPMMLVRHRGQRANFAAVWTQGPAPEEVRVEPVGAKGELRYRVAWSGGSREHILPVLESVR